MDVELNTQCVIRRITAQLNLRDIVFYIANPAI